MAVTQNLGWSQYNLKARKFSYGYQVILKDYTNEVNSLYHYSLKLYSYLQHPLHHQF